MGKWINRLSKIQNSTRKQVPEVPKAPFGTSGTALRQEYSEIKGTPKVVDKLPKGAATAVTDEMRRTIPAMSSEQELERLHDRLTVAWNKGEVGRDTAETLTCLMWERSRQLHRAEGTTVSLKSAAAAVPDDNAVRVYPSDIRLILVAELGACSCCGKAQWWTKSCGQRVCGICHPNPHREELVSDAA